MRVTRTVKNLVWVLTLDNPPVNALSTRLLELLAAQLAAFRASDARVLVMAAAGERAFSAGADLKEEFPPRTELRKFQRILEILRELETLPKVTIAAIEHATLGGACELVLCCDLRVCSSNAVFGFPEVTIGEFPGTGGTLRLPWLIGEARARQLLITGERITAERAEQIGLVHRVVPPEQALASALAWAEDLTMRPPQSVAAVKQSILRNRDHDAIAGAAADALLSQQVSLTRDAQQGRKSFLERKRAIYVGDQLEGRR
jgi:enoyl-CoA hydratase